MHNSTHKKEHKQERMILEREHMCQCEEKGEQTGGRGKAKGWKGRLGPSSPGEGPSQNCGLC